MAAHQDTAAHSDSQVGEDGHHRHDDDDEGVGPLDLVVHVALLALPEGEAAVEHHHEGPPCDHVVDHEPDHADEGGAGNEVDKGKRRDGDDDDHELQQRRGIERGVRQGAVPRYQPSELGGREGGEEGEGERGGGREGKRGGRDRDREREAGVRATVASPRQ